METAVQCNLRFLTPSFEPQIRRPDVISGPPVSANLFVRLSEPPRICSALLLFYLTLVTLYFLFRLIPFLCVRLSESILSFPRLLRFFAPLCLLPLPPSLFYSVSLPVCAYLCVSLSLFLVLDLVPLALPAPLFRSLHDI